MYPAALVDRYRADGLWGAKSIADEFRSIAATFPDRDAVATPERRMTYSQLDTSSDAIAAGLLESGLEPGDRVILQVGNNTESVELFYGLIKAALVPVCTLADHGHHEIDTIANMVQARAHAVDLDKKVDERKQFAAEVRDRVPSMSLLIQVAGDGTSLPDRSVTMAGLRGTPAEVTETRLSKVRDFAGPDDLAVLQLSGGTSGTPKLIPRLHAEYWYNGKATGQRWVVTEHDRIAHVIPIVHNAGLHAAMFPAHSAGACLVLDSVSRGLGILSTLARERVTGMLMSPLLVEPFAKDPIFPEVAANLRWMSMTGMKVPAAAFDRLEEFGVTVVQNFGMSEGIVFASPLDAPEEMRRNTVGYPLSPLDEVKLVDLDNPEVEVSLGEPGELLVRGPYTIRGYFDADDHNAQVFTADGFYKTGDVMSAVEIDGIRAYRVEGRVKDLVNRGGEKINASEVESILIQHERITLAAVVAMPDARLGERACAYVVSSDGADVSLNEVQRHFEALGVARYKWPERIETRSSLPTTGMGKIAKRVLAAEISERVAAEQKPAEVIA
jgi:2,3-dihydroxybenzoate-AMP ligase